MNATRDLKKYKPARVYLAGPMRGIPEFNFPAFDEAAARGRAMGLEIISPAELDRAHGLNETGHDGKVDDNGLSAVCTHEFMASAAWRDFKAIVGRDPSDRTLRTEQNRGCDFVALLPGWENSRGARAEKAIAEWVGIMVLDARTFKPFGEPPLGGPVVAQAPPGCYVETLPPPTQDGPREIRNGDFVVKDSGKRQQFATGAVRDDQDGKGFFDSIPYEALECLAKLYEAGAKKYGDDNWRKGIPLRAYLNSATRHLLKLNNGWADEDHAAAVLWNICGYVWTACQVKAGKLPASLANDRLTNARKSA
jgi:hypothetical protein